MLFFSFASVLKVRIHALAIKHMELFKHIVYTRKAFFTT